MIGYLIYFGFRVPITSEDFKEKILAFDEAVLRYGEKFKIFFMLEVDIEDFIKHYKELRTQDFWGDDEMKPYRLLDLNMLGRVSNKVFTPPWYSNSSSGFKTIIYGVNIIFDYTDFFHYENTLTYYENDLKNMNFWYEYISMHFSTFNYDWGKLEDSVKLQLIPRFNSFLRDVSQVVKGLGGEIQIDEYSDSCIVPQGILLDGKIIYQEDIDEGRVSSYELRF